MTVLQQTCLWVDGQLPSFIDWTPKSTIILTGIKVVSVLSVDQHPLNLAVGMCRIGSYVAPERGDDLHLWGCLYALQA